MISRHLSIFARIALLAMFWQILVWPLSNAMAAERGLPGQVPVCTPSGIKWVSFGDEAPAEKQNHQRCPLCVTGQGDTSLLDSHAAIVVPLSFAREADIVPSGFPAFAFFATAPPPARAPPALS